MNYALEKRTNRIMAGQNHKPSASRVPVALGAPASGGMTQVGPNALNFSHTSLNAAAGAQSLSDLFKPTGRLCGTRVAVSRRAPLGRT